MVKIYFLVQFEKLITQAQVKTVGLCGNFSDEENPLIVGSKNTTATLRSPMLSETKDSVHTSSSLCVTY